MQLHSFFGYLIKRRMDKLPSTVDGNAYKAYINEEIIYSVTNKFLNSLDLNWESQSPPTLRITVLNSLIENWHEVPILSEISRQADKNYILEHLDVNLPIKMLSTHIREDIFWKRCFRSRWKNCFPEVAGRRWISMYMEKDLAEMLENLAPCNYDQEEMQRILEIAAPYIEELNISCLQPSMDDKTDHVPFDFILANLTELSKLHVSYIAKKIDTKFYLGCSSMSPNDTTYLCRGLQKTYDLLEFCLFSTRLDLHVIKAFAKSLDKGCPNLTSLNLTNCCIGDNGFAEFTQVLSSESFVNLKRLILTNNFFSQKTALYLSKMIKNRRIEHLDISLNPIGSEGAATIFSIIHKLPIEFLNISACSITETIGKLLLKLLVENKTLLHFNISNNELENELGMNIFRIIGFNKVLKHLDLRNTSIQTKLRNNITSVLFQNRDRF